jgi:hypothetical protein
MLESCRLRINLITSCMKVPHRTTRPRKTRCPMLSFAFDSLHRGAIRGRGCIGSGIDVFHSSGSLLSRCLVDRILSQELGVVFKLFLDLSCVSNLSRAS